MKVKDHSEKKNRQRILCLFASPNTDAFIKNLKGIGTSKHVIFEKKPDHSENTQLSVRYHLEVINRRDMNMKATPPLFLAIISRHQ